MIFLNGYCFNKKKVTLHEKAETLFVILNFTYNIDSTKFGTFSNSIVFCSENTNKMKRENELWKNFSFFLKRNS